MVTITSQNIKDIDTLFLEVGFTSLHVHTKLVYNTKVKVKVRDFNPKLDDKDLMPILSFYLSKKKKTKIYLLYSEKENYTLAIAMDISTNKVLLNEKVAEFVFLEGAYKKWINSIIADINGDGALEICIFKRLVDFEVEERDAPNISNDESFYFNFNGETFNYSKLSFENFKDYTFLPSFEIVDSTNNIIMKKIKISGVAANAKMGAVIITDSNEVFYIQGLDEWADDLLDKKLEVSGDISEEYYNPDDLKDKNGMYRSGMSGTKTNIQNAIWKLLK